MLCVSIIAGGSGAVVLTTNNTKIIALLVPILLIVVAIYFTLGPRVTDQKTTPRISHKIFGLFVAPSIAFYDVRYWVGRSLHDSKCNASWTIAVWPSHFIFAYFTIYAA